MIILKIQTIIIELLFWGWAGDFCIMVTQKNQLGVGDLDQLAIVYKISMWETKQKKLPSWIDKWLNLSLHVLSTTSNSTINYFNYLNYKSDLCHLNLDNCPLQHGSLSPHIIVKNNTQLWNIQSQYHATTLAHYNMGMLHHT